MLVRLGCWLVLLAVACVALANLEGSKDYAEEMEYDINTFIDEDAFQQKCDCGSEASKCELKDGKKVCTCKDGYIPVGPDKICTQMCNYTNPCQNGGICWQNVCSCLNGTSGHLCKTIDGCRSKCGREQCFYNVSAREIYCKCDTGYAFDDYNKMCKDCSCGYISSGCYFGDFGTKYCNCTKGFAQLDDKCERCDCGFNGNCTLSHGIWDSKKTCKCEKGYAEKYGTCRDCDCGEHGTCSFSYGKKTCHCNSGFDEYQGKCEECDCGMNGSCTLSNSIWNIIKTCMCEKGYAEKYGTCKECDCGAHGRCSFSYGVKTCHCNSGFDEYQGKCKECDCGDFSRCKFDIHGKKECTCDESYALNSGVCTKCDCGPEASKCEFNEGKKVCTCKEGYIPVGNDKICTQICNDTNPCQNGGTCSQKVCSCLNGTSGHLCKTIDDCRSRCGSKACFYNVTSRDLYCKCNTGYAFDDYYKMCRVCSCSGLYSNGCHFDLGKKNCNCAKGYAQSDDTCKRCDCGIHGSCTLSDSIWGKKCTCEEGYAEKFWTCLDIDECESYTACMDIHSICVNTQGSYSCYCKAGYSLVKDGSSEKNNRCIEVPRPWSTNRPWRTATIVVGVLFGFVIFGLLLGIYSKHLDSQ